MSKPQLYLKARVTRRWRQIVDGQDRVLAFSPYITGSAVIDALAGLGQRCSLYTDMDPTNFASEASHLPCVRRLVLEHKVRVFHLPGLHAKVVLVPGCVVTVGSQNFTSGGSKNLEATLVTEDSRVVSQALAEAEGWIKDGQPRPVTEAWLDDLREAVARMRKDYLKWERSAAEAASTFWERQQRREDEERERQLEAERRAAEERRRQQEEERLRAEQERQRQLELQRRAAEDRRRQQEERERQAERERSLRRLRYASEVVTGRMTNQAGWTLKSTRPTSRFTVWRGEPEPHLLRGHPDWYVCFLRDSMRWGWARVCDSCISFVNTTYQPWVTLGLGADCHRVRAVPHHDPADPTSNIRFVVSGAGWQVELFGMFYVGGLTIGRAGVNQNPGVADRITRAVNQNTGGLRDRVLEQLTEPLYFHLRSGDRADNFFGGRGTTYHVRLGFLGGNAVLVAGLHEQWWYEMFADRPPVVTATPAPV